MSDIALSA